MFRIGIPWMEFNSVAKQQQTWLHRSSQLVQCFRSVFSSFDRCHGRNKHERWFEKSFTRHLNRNISCCCNCVSQFYSLIKSRIRDFGVFKTFLGQFHYKQVIDFSIDLGLWILTFLGAGYRQPGSRNHFAVLFMSLF